MLRHIHSAAAKTLLACAAAAALAALAAPAAAEGTLDKVKSTGYITVGHRDSSIPFSYYDNNQKPIGYSMDLCKRIVDAVKKKLKMPNLEVRYQLDTSANRIPLMANGTIDLECGSTTNNLEREKQVAFSVTTFVTADRWIAKKSSDIKSVQDMKGKTVVSTAGTSNIKEITEINNKENLGMNIISANGHAEAFQMVETGRAVAFIMDDILLYGLAASSRNPAEFEIGPVALSLQPYAIMLRKGDPAFKKVVDDTLKGLFKSGEINKIYDKWFLGPIPPRGVKLDVPMSAELKKVIAHPTDSGDAKDYE